MKAPLVHPDPPLVVNTPTRSLMRLYQKSQTTFESERATGIDGRIQVSEEALDPRQVQHWQQRPGASTQEPTLVPPLPGAEQEDPGGHWGDAKSASFKEGRGAAEWDRRAGTAPWTPLLGRLPEPACSTRAGLPIPIPTPSAEGPGGGRALCGRAGPRSRQGAAGPPHAASAAPGGTKARPGPGGARPGGTHSPPAGEERSPFTRRSRESRDTSMYSMLFSGPGPSLPPRGGL